MPLFNYGGIFYCPGREATLNIVVSLTCTSYLCGSLIVL